MSLAARFRNAIRAVGLLVAPAATTAEASCPKITAGAGAPAAADPNGSVYLRTDGAAGTTIYHRVGGAWVAVGATAVSGTDFGSGGIAADAIAESTAAAGVIIDGLLIKDERLQPTGAGIATGDAGITLKDNLASAWDVKEAANVYQRFVTTNDGERVQFGKLVTLPIQTIDMADVQKALVFPTAGAGEVQLTGQILLVDANSSASEDLLLPPEASSSGLMLIIANTGGEDINVKEDSDTTLICTISTTETAIVVCDGTTWRGGVVKTT